MRNFLLRLVGIIVAAIAPIAVATVATPAVSSAECLGGRAWDPLNKVCDPPPPVPAWYQPAPYWTQSWAPPWVPPPPPPQWAVDLQLQPVWDQRLNQWTWIYVR